LAKDSLVHHLEEEELVENASHDWDKILVGVHRSLMPSKVDLNKEDLDSLQKSDT
jgi:hypothetical protein